VRRRKVFHEACVARAMDNTPEAQPPANPTGEPPAAAPTPEAANPSAAPTPAASAPTSAPASPPRPGPGMRDPVRTNLKIAGFLLLLLGAYFGFNFGQAAYLGPQAETWGAFPGGDLHLHAASHPNGTYVVQYPGGANSTSGHLDAGGNATMQAAQAYLKVSVDGSASVAAIVPSGLHENVTVDGKQAAALQGFDISLFRTYWVHVAVSALVLVAGVLMFRLVARRLVMGLVAVGLLGALFMVVGGGDLLMIVAAAAMGFALWSLSKGKDRFRTVRLGNLTL